MADPSISIGKVHDSDLDDDESPSRVSHVPEGSEVSSMPAQTVMSPNYADDEVMIKEPTVSLMTKLKAAGGLWLHKFIVELRERVKLFQTKNTTMFNDLLLCPVQLSRTRPSFLAPPMTPILALNWIINRRTYTHKI